MLAHQPSPMEGSLHLICGQQALNSESVSHLCETSSGALHSCSVAICDTVCHSSAASPVVRPG